MPQCSFLPCKHFGKYIQPFGYCALKSEQMYVIFREFYCRYFCYLNTISSIPQSILGLSVIFEELFNYSDNRLFNHLASIGKLALPEGKINLYHVSSSLGGLIVYLCVPTQ